MSQTPIDLVHRFLVFEPSRRLRPSNALAHPWLTSEPLLIPDDYPAPSSQCNTLVTRWGGRSLGEWLSETYPQWRELKEWERSENHGNVIVWCTMYVIEYGKTKQRNASASSITQKSALLGLHPKWSQICLRVSSGLIRFWFWSREQRLAEVCEIFNNRFMFYGNNHVHRLKVR